MEYREANRGFQLREVAGGWRLFTHPAFHDQVADYVLSWDTRRLSQAALETLAVIAYHQPVTREGVRAIRGVNSDGVIGSLKEKGLVRECGHEADRGQAILYGTTRLFLERFGLKSLRELPPLEDFAPDEESKQFIRERLSGRQMESTLEDAMDDIEDERELLGDDLGQTADDVDVGTASRPTLPPRARRGCPRMLDEGERIVPMRLQRFLARAGVASRRGSERLMTSGRVRVNGVVVSELGSKVDPSVDVVTVDGRPCSITERSRYVMLYKPQGYITTMSDPQGPPHGGRARPLQGVPGALPGRAPGHGHHGASALHHQRQPGPGAPAPLAPCGQALRGPGEGCSHQTRARGASSWRDDGRGPGRPRQGGDSP